MSAIFEYFRGMRAAKHRGHYIQRSQEAAAVLGIPQGITPNSDYLPSYRDVIQAAGEARIQAVSRFAETPGEFNFLDAAQGLFGDRWRHALSSGGVQHGMESEEALDVTFFRNITGQLLVTYTQKGYENPEFVGDDLFTTIEAPLPWNLGAEIVPKISSVEQGPQNIQPGMPYPNAQMIQDWISYAPMGKFGETLNLTLEMVGTDRTGQVGLTAEKLGYRARYNKEWQELAVAMGITVTEDNFTLNGNSFSWLGQSYNTYLSGGSNWVNKQTGWAVAGANYQLVANMEFLFSQILDPYTGIVIHIPLDGMMILCPFGVRYEVYNMVNFGKIRVGNYPTGAADNILFDTANMLDVKYPVKPSKIMYQLLLQSGLTQSQAENYLYIGNFKRALRYRQYLPLQTMFRPPNNDAEWQQDIVQSIKTRRGGIPTIEDPRFIGQSINT